MLDCFSSGSTLSVPGRENSCQQVVRFTGEAAMREVAKADGQWSWAVVGPNPKLLPFCGAGLGGLEEMGVCLTDNPHCFGLMRLTFGVGAEARAKFAFVFTKHTDNEDGQAAIVHRMAEAIDAFAPCQARALLCSLRECEATMERVIHQIQDTSSEAERELVTIEQFNAAKEQYKRAHPDLAQESLLWPQIVERLQVPRPEVLEPEPEVVGKMSSGSRLRKKVKLFAKGDLVEIFSLAKDRWIDGEVTEDGIEVKKGWMKVIFCDGKRWKFEWIAPGDMEARLRPSHRPRPPPPRTGRLSLEIANFWFVRMWDKNYMELSEGFLRWWDSPEVAKSGKPASGSMYLLGLQHQLSGREFTIRSGNGNDAHKFMCTNEELAQSWTHALWEHAGYCQHVSEFKAGRSRSESRHGRKGAPGRHGGA